MDDKKKKRRIIIFALIAATLTLAVYICYVPVSSYLAGLNAPLPEPASSELISESAAAEVEAAITDEEIEKLLSGETTLENLESSLFSEGEADSFAASESAASSEAASSSGEAEAASESKSESASSSSSSKAASTSSSKAASSSAASSASSSASASASHTASSAVSSEPSYEAEVKALVQELYILRAQALKDLDSNIDSAKAEYHALPESQQTQTRKIAIAFSRAGQLTKLQSYYDKEVDRIVGEMRTILKANGQSTALADEALASYKNQKSEMYSSLMKKLYD